MRRRGFLMNSAVLLLLIPLLLLIATYEDASSFIITSQSERVQVERTFRITSYLEEDFKNTLELSTKRALALSIDFATSEKPLDNASKALGELVMYGSYRYMNESGWGNREKFFMENNTIKDWLENMRIELAKQGYTMITAPDEIINNIELTIAPLDSFHIAVKARIPKIVIEDSSGTVIYNSSIPQRGYLYVVIPIEGLEDPLFPYLTKGRASRIVSACRFAYPSVTPPYIKLDGYGLTDTKAFSAQLYNIPKTGSIVYGDNYLEGNGVLGYVLSNPPSREPNAPYIFNTSMNGKRVSPTFLFYQGDMGVMVFDKVGQNGGSSAQWCEKQLEWRTNLTLPSSAPLNSLVLLVFDRNRVPFGIAKHEGNKASIRIYKRSSNSCEIARYWIEYWGDDKILIWLNTTNTRDYTVYYSTSNEALKWEGDITIFPYYQEDYLLEANYRKSSEWIENISLKSFAIRFEMWSNGLEDFDAGLGISLKEKENILTVDVDYPESVNDVQIPIHLNSTIAGLINHDSNNMAEIEVYADEGLVQRIPFWIEYWNDKGALIWVRGDIPGTFYIRYNTGELTRGNGDEVFLWFYNITTTINDGKMKTFDVSTYDIQGDVGIRFSMKPTKNKAWNAGIRIYTKYKYWLGYYTDKYYINFTDDLKNTEGALRIQDYWWDDYYGDWYQDDATSTSKTRGCCSYRTYEVVILPGYWSGGYPLADVSFFDYGQTTRGYFKNPVRVNHDSNYLRVYNEPLLKVSLINIADNNNKNRATFDWIFIRKYLNLSNIQTTISPMNMETELEFIDDNPGHTDTGHDGDKLAIMGDWEDTIDYSSGTWYVNIPQRYEVVVQTAESSLQLIFVHNPNVAVTTFDTSQATIPYHGSFLTVSLVIDNLNNNAYFDWVFIVPYPYNEYTEDNVSLSSSEIYSAGGKYSTARVYDIQPFIACLQSQKYFGVENAPSFFERLEGGDSSNRAYYEMISREMQIAVYGKAKYPIGLISFILPKDLPPNLNFLIRKRPAADYIYLDYQNYPSDDPNVKKVLGISTNGGVPSPILDENFYLTHEIAKLIFGEQGARDLLLG